MKKKLSPIILWGATGQARVLRELLSTSEYEVIACFDNNPLLTPPFPDVPLTGDWHSFVRWRESHPGSLAFSVAIGGAHGRVRLQMQQRLIDAGLDPVVLIHARSFVAADAIIGAGSQILAMSAICAGVRISDACIVNTSASVDHECALGAGVHIGPGATLCGNVTVGDGAFIGAGATILPRISIGPDAIVGAGAVVTKDVAASANVVGSPARARQV